MPNTTSKSTTTASAARKGSNEVDALALLMKDHADVKALFEQYEGLGDRAMVSKKKLVDKICLELTKHATAEEELFYPLVRDAIADAEDMVDEATVEHASAKDLIAQLQEMDADEELFDAKVKVLSELIEHHVREEEDEMFPKVRKSSLDLVEIGMQIERRKAEITTPETH